MENRVIKFRVYILDNKGKVECYFHEWLDGDGWKNDYYAPIVCNGVFNHEELGDGFLGQIIRKQFTGLTDKNGVEIYEGDVMCWPQYEGTKNQTRWVVSYNPLKGFCSWSPVEEAVVIGNLFENPELLNP